MQAFRECRHLFNGDAPDTDANGQVEPQDQALFNQFMTDMMFHKASDFFSQEFLSNHGLLKDEGIMVIDGPDVDPKLLNNCETMSTSKDYRFYFLRRPKY